MLLCHQNNHLKWFEARFESYFDQRRLTLNHRQTLNHLQISFNLGFNCILNMHI